MNEMTRIAAIADPARGFTALDFEQMMEMGAFADNRVELAGGVLEKMMPSLLAHGEHNGSMWTALRTAFTGLPFRVAIDLAIRIDDATVRAPDVAVAKASIDPQLIPDACDIVMLVEIADTTLGRDLGAKLADYARAGVPDYWVVDLKARVVRLMSGPEGTGYRSETIARFGEPIAVPGTDQSITVD